MSASVLLEVLDAFLVEVAAFEDRVSIAKSPEQTWRLLHRIADRATPELRAEFLDAVAETVNGIVFPQVRAALARGDLATAEQLIPWERVGDAVLRAALPERLRVIVMDAATTAEATVPDARLTVRFDLVNARAVAWASAHAAELVTAITAETRAAIRAVILRALVDGLAPRVAAREIRTLVGLTERDATAVQNLRARLLAEARQADQVERMARRYAERLLRRRAENIARTETMAAALQGQRELWDQAVRDGSIDPGDLEREWLVAEDERLCPMCRPMQGRRAPIDGLYEHPTLGPVVGPILHPQCRCAEILVPVRVAA